MKRSPGRPLSGCRLMVGCCLLIGLALGLSTALAAGPDHHYVTRDDFEPDKCASIWLIKRFVDPQAVFIIHRPGAPLSHGILFDVPEAKIRRYHNRSTFEYILQTWKIDDPKLDYIGKLIHDIEINTWQEKAWPQTLKLQQDLTGLIEQAAEADDIIHQSLIYFDTLYRTLD